MNWIKKCGYTSNRSTSKYCPKYIWPPGLNPLTGQTETAVRRQLKVNDELPLREEYANMIAAFLK
ncbi:MAG: hypothetical protein FWH48_03275 [Oscillospiraceae bacterium]|nr:hypothetical protein [Oscillospiraceae bacterium]